jgi:hypothetical protein
MGCTHSQFDTLAPTTVDDLADTFDTATLTAMQADVAALAAGAGPTAAAWRMVIATLAEAHEQRYYTENPPPDRAPELSLSALIEDRPARACPTSTTRPGPDGKRPGRAAVVAPRYV